jgi:hypothetical protein
MILKKSVRSILLFAAAIGCSALVMATAPSAAHAYNSDAALERDGAQCTRQVSRSERKYGIPQRLLGAMAATETGRYHKGLGVQIPWPWTINVEGKPYFFDSKPEVIAAVEKFQARGATSIDVGCMQINLRHHPHAFRDLNQAFDPAANVDYAARFLRGHYDDTHSWKTAVGRYHSRTPAYATRYIAKVYGQWYGLASTVADNRAASKSRYKSFVRVEGSGEESQFSNNTQTFKRTVVTPSTPKNDSVVKSAKREPTRAFELSIVRPASAAGKIETAPTQGSSEISGPLVMSMGKAKDFTTPKVKSISVSDKSGSDADSRFIRFVD